MRRTKETFGRARHERRSVDSSWESPSSCRAPREVLTLVTLFWNTCSQKEGGPIGQPRREKPQRVMGMSDGSGDWVASASSGMKSRDLPLLRWRPTDGPSRSMMCSAVARSYGWPMRVPLSRYQVLRARPGTLALICSTMGWNVRAKPRGPSGSPCCTPWQLWMLFSPRWRRGWHE